MTLSPATYGGLAQLSHDAAILMLDLAAEVESSADSFGRRALGSSMALSA